MAPMDRVCRLTELFRSIRRKTPGGGLSYCLVETTLNALEKVHTTHIAHSTLSHITLSQGISDYVPTVRELPQ